MLILCSNLIFQRAYIHTECTYSLCEVASLVYMSTASRFISYTTPQASAVLHKSFFACDNRAHNVLALHKKCQRYLLTVHQVAAKQF